MTLEGITIDTNPTLMGSQTALSIAENDDGTATGTYTIVLTSAPSGGNAIIDVLESSDDITVSPKSCDIYEQQLEHVPQEVTVTVANDFDATDESATITHRARNSSDYMNMRGQMTSSSP